MNLQEYMNKLGLGISREECFDKLYSKLIRDSQYSEADCRRLKTTIACDQNQYPYIPKSTHTFNGMLKFVEETYGHRKSFIDVGSGLGDKVLFSHLSGLFDTCSGLEYDTYTNDLAIKHTLPLMDKFKPTHNCFTNGDAFKFDFLNYDTVYLYCPLRDINNMKNLLQHIYDTIEKDSIILFFDACGVMDFWPDKKIKVKLDKQYSGVYIITKTEERKTTPFGC